MSRGITITIAITISLGVVATLSTWQFASLVVEPVIAPRVELKAPHFDSGPCVQDYALWVIPWGQHRMVTATFQLRNDGLSDGRVRVVFTAEGARVTDADFFIGAGKTETKNFQFQVNDCGEHSFRAQLGGVTRSSYA